MIDRQTIDRIMDAANIVDVISEFVTLRKRGTSYKGLCPFHDDTTPSFSVSPAKGIYKCFACGESGNTLNFIMKHEQMTYPEALRWLAKKYGIEIKERELSEEEKKNDSEREAMFLVNEWAADYFEKSLHDDVDGASVGLPYYRSRGIRDDIIRKFRLGFSPSRRNALSEAAVKAGYKEDYLVRTGLCLRRDDGTITDRFYGRVIFPWIGISGKVVAFGGRLLDSRTKGVTQKYVNSSDSEIYHKEKELYGIYQAKKAISKLDLVYMVEGYTDVIAMHQCGIENVVANSGTALSIHQIRLLRRFTTNIVLLYDGDEAGIHAAMRGTDMLLAEGMNVKVLILPDNDDPDSFARKHTAEEFRNYIAEHQKDFIEFKSDIMLNGVTDPTKKSEAITSIVGSIAVIKDQILRATYIRECSNRTGIAEATLISSMNRLIYSGKEQERKESERSITKQHVGNNQPIGKAAPQQNTPKVEQLLIQMVIRHGEEIIIRNVDDGKGNQISLNVAQYISYDLGLDNLSFSNHIYNKILDEAVEQSGKDSFSAEEYFTRHHDIEISTLAVSMSVEEFKLPERLAVKNDESNLRELVFHLILDFRMNIMECRLRDLQAELAQYANDADKMREILQAIKQTQDIRNVLARKLGNDIVS